jgi:4-amino-4-deoxy-L-arabinose transferase
VHVSDTHRSIVWLAAGLLAMWFVGLFVRGYWRPDEPREAALVQSMAGRADLALPQLAGRIFAEKPPLMYRLAAASQLALGTSPAATRAPGLLYAAVAVLAVAALAYAIGGMSTALTSALMFATFSLVYQTQIWLACDAPLLAGVSIALLGMYRGLTAPQRGVRLAGYLCMHIGLTIAFFAKNFAAWLVPATALLVFLLWERRVRELLRWELWVGFVVPVLCIGLWTASIAGIPEGHDYLRALFWNNLVGRAMAVTSDSGHAYTQGHHNWPGKYFVELFAYLMPWTFAAVAAVRTAWHAARADSPQQSAWRFAISASLPSLVVLSFAATARGIYAAPSLIGMALLIGLWATDRKHAGSSRTARAIACSGGLLAALGAVVFTVSLVLAFAENHHSVQISIISCVAALVAIAVGWRTASSRQIPSPVTALQRLGLAYAVLLSLGVLSISLTVNRWQDLSAVATLVDPARNHHPLVLWRPDETTLAWADMYLREKPRHTFYADGDIDAEARQLAKYLGTAPDAGVLVLAPSHHWRVATWLDYLRRGAVIQSPADLSGIDPLLQRFGMHSADLIELPGGRRYALLKYRGAATRSLSNGE